MWPFKKKVKPYFKTTSLQVGDYCVCINDEPHTDTHQKLLAKGDVYRVRKIVIDRNGGPNGFGGPFISLENIHPAHDSMWSCARFEKVMPSEKKSDILEQVMLPADGWDEVKERKEAKKLVKAK